MAEKEKKVKKSEKRTENAVQRFYRETTGELRKVNWPTWAEAKRLTWLVLLVMVAMGAFLSIVDSLANRLITWVLGIG